MCRESRHSFFKSTKILDDITLEQVAVPRAEKRKLDTAIINYLRYGSKQEKNYWTPIYPGY